MSQSCTAMARGSFSGAHYGLADVAPGPRAVFPGPSGTLAVFLAAAFMIIAPLSLATKLEAAPQLKIVRIALCGVGTLLAVGSGALRRAGAASLAVAVFASFYVLAAAWSPFPLAGVAYKSIFLSAIVFGLALGGSFADRARLRWAMRLLGVVAVAASLVVLHQYRSNPAAVTRIGRLAFLGMNANAVGMTAAGYLFFAVFLALNERGLWRLVGTLGSAVLLTLILASGSRAAMAMGLLGVTLQVVPWIPYPRRVVPPVVVAALLLVLLSETVESQAIERFTDFEKNTRQGMWAAGVRLFSQSPIVGHGWLTTGRSTGNLQNAYLQVLAEGGVIGGVLLLWAAAQVTRMILEKRRRVAPADRPIYYFATGIIAGLALHAIAESSLLHGSTINTFLFGFALGVVESLKPTWLSQTEAPRVSRQQAARPHDARALALR